MPKMYFAEFTNNDTGEVFQKFGHTSKNDAMIRLNNIVEEFPQYTARVLAAVYHHNVEKCQGVEEAFKVMYPKNFWVEEKLSGITECVKLESDVRYKIIEKLMKLNKTFKKECFPE